MLFSTVVFTHEDPITGWVTNFDSVLGMCIGLQLGAIQVIYISYKYPAIFMPVEYDDHLGSAHVQTQVSI